jgi:L-glutamine-phosphate cytidylyltransferase
MRAAVLAAGRGVRMGGQIPKTLIPVRAHEPLLYYILRGVEQANITDLLVVTGFASQRVQEYVTSNWSHECTFVFNARYASWGNFHTVRVALDQSPGLSLLVVNSDIIVPPVVYQRVLQKHGDLVLAVQRRENLDDEDMRVRLSGDRVLDIGKDLKPVHSHGEFAGVSLLRPDAARLYSEIATDLEWRAQTSLYYEDVYRMMIDQVEVRAATVEPGEYAEVDTPRDLEAADNVIRDHADAWPPITAAEAQPA